MNIQLKCVSCNNSYDYKNIRYRCDCGEVLEADYPQSDVDNNILKQNFDERLKMFSLPQRSGVWRYKELLLPINEANIVSKSEGNTNLYSVGKSCGNGQKSIGKFVGIETMYIKHEGENPTGSFKDRGMTTGVSMAKQLGMKAVACASTGNTSASLASYAAKAGMTAYVFIPDGKISFGKLAQTLAYGAKTIQIKGDFDVAMKLVEEVCNEKKIYLLNSINPFRIEGQKSIAFEFIHQLKWQAPDWVVIPAGNLGNTSAIGKALIELYNQGFIKKIPRIASIQAAGANPFYRSYKAGFKTRFKIKAETIATAIRIGNPVSYLRAKKVIEKSNGIVAEVTDTQILEAKAVVDSAGIGCEPGSATSVAGTKKLVDEGLIKKNESVVCITTGHILKDTDTILKYHTGKLENIKAINMNKIIEVGSDLDAIIKALAAK